MKKLVLILLFVFIASAVYSGDFDDLKLHFNNSRSYLEYKTLPKNTCDLCGCYMGIDGENKNELGFRYRLRVFNGPHEDTGDPVLNSEIKEYYNTVEITGRYFITRKIQLSFLLPFGINHVETGNFSGFGDMMIMAKFLIHGKLTALPGKIYNDRIFIGGGFKIPTGNYNKTSNGEIEPHFQTGTGSYDFLLLGTYIARILRFGVNADIVYKINTANPNNYKFANRFNMSASLLFIANLNEQVSIIPNTGFYYEQADPDKLNNIDDEGSGGKVLFLKAGMNLNLKNLSFSVDFQKPVYESFNGYQPSNSLRLISTVSYIF